MTDLVKLDEAAFRKGARETFTLKPLRDVVRQALTMGKERTQVRVDIDASEGVVVEKGRDKHWHVKQAS